MSLLKSLGVNDCRLNINSMGCPECRKAYGETIRKQLSKSLNELCENCQRRFDKNIFRILDCKDEKCYEISSCLEPLDRYLCQSCKEHFDKVQKGLTDNQISYSLNKHLVRGFDYYTRTVFEITHSSLGAQNALCGGGRYDNLIEQFDGPPTGAVGFAMGVERIIEVIKKEIPQTGPTVYVVVTDESLKPEVFKVVRELRRHSISADMDYETKSLKAQFRNADRLQARFVAVLGDDELSKGSIKLKEMKSGVEKTIKLTSLIESIK